MKKNISLNVILFAVFVVWTTITVFIVYKDIDTPLATPFVIGYVIYLLLYALSFIVLILINIRRLSWAEIRKKLFVFIAWFISLSGLFFLLNYLFRPSGAKVWDWGTPLGLSLAIAFSDMMFFRKQKKNK